MKRILAIVLAVAAALMLPSCGESTSTESGVSSSSSTVSETASFAAPEKISAAGNKASVFEGETVTADITPADIIEKETGLDSYTVTASWISDTKILAAYFHNEMPMPNYPVKKVKLRVYDVASGTASVSKEIDPTDEFPSVKVYNGGCAVMSRTAVTFYDAELKTLSSYKVDSEKTVFDISDDGKVLAYAETSGNIRAILNGEDKIVEEKSGNATAIAVSADGKYVAYYKDSTPYVADIASGSSEKVDTGDKKLASAVQIFWLGNDALFMDRPVAGTAKALVSVAYSADKKSTSYPLIGGEFENPYARGKFFENGGKLYLAYGLCADNASKGNLELICYNSDYEAATLKEIPAGYYGYNSYSCSDGGDFLINENLADGSAVKNYIHVIRL